METPAFLSFKKKIKPISMIYACVEYVFKKNDVFVAILLYVIVFYYIQNKPHTVKLKKKSFT